ncbi:MAG: cbb3-type cytochrome c oxidase N-terminal domain-containing protein [Ferruginibacter sp.]
MFLQKISQKKLAFTTLFTATSLAIHAQQTTPVQVPAGNNLLATLLIITTVVLLFVIYGMGQVLIALSRQLLDKRKAASKIVVLSMLGLFCLLSQSVISQDVAAKEVVDAIPNYGGLSAKTFYFLAAVLATEVIAVLFLFYSIRRIHVELLPEKVAAIAKESKLFALWVRLNKKLTRSIPLEQEADALLDHNYDGIQELDNSLPPWWKYGFILTIVFAVVYLLNFHVVGNGKNPTQEYLAEMSDAKIEKEEYDAKNKDKIDEANVPMASAGGIKNGKDFYTANCVACHGQLGEGGAGPNLTDDYWLHKGSLNDVYNTIKKGYPDKGMQSWAIKFNPKEMSEIASYIITLKGTNPPGGKAPQGELSAEKTTGDVSKITLPDNKVQ